MGRPITLIIPPERLDEERAILERLVPRGAGRALRDRARFQGRPPPRHLPDDLPDPQCPGPRRRRLEDRPRHHANEAVAADALRESEERYRRAAAEAARAAEANAKFRAFFEQGTNFAGVLALDGTVVEANRLCLDACGFTRDEVMGKPFWECGWWNLSAALMDMVRTACSRRPTERMFRTETNYFVADGSERMIDLILAPVTDEAGRVLFVAATGTDITERRRMEDALREPDRQEGRVHRAAGP